MDWPVDSEKRLLGRKGKNKNAMLECNLALSHLSCKGTCTQKGVVAQIKAA